MGKRVELAGQRFGYLVAVRDVGCSGAGQRRWLARCDCGAERVLRQQDLRKATRCSPECPRAIEGRLLSYISIDPSTECWSWTGHVTNGGYGQVKVAGEMRLAHRAAYALWRGPLTPSLTIDHLCRNTRCINPQHLEEVTQRENILRGTGVAAQNIRKTACPQGHPYAGENLRSYRYSGRMIRACRTCTNARNLINLRNRRARLLRQKAAG